MIQTNPDHRKFTLKASVKSIKYAMEGIILFCKREHNARLHILATILVIIMSFYFNISKVEAISLTFAVGLVITSEIFNTAVEKMADFITRENKPEIKHIKDLAAGAVLVAAFTALIVGCIVFIPKIF